MSRSIRVRQELIPRVKQAVTRSGFVRQKDVALELDLADSTIRNFLNGRPVDSTNFIEICRVLNLEWQDVADLGEPDGDDLSQVSGKEPQERKTPAQKIPFVLPQLDVSTFTGRREELDQLKQLLSDRQGEKVCTIVGLAGAGGIGKSALACHFATQHKNDFPDGVIGLRVDGKEPDAIAREFARRGGEQLDLEDERDAATLMQEVFAHRRMLLIFDNADNSDKIRKLRPGGNRCAVIVTTRDRLLPIALDIPEQGRIDLLPLSDPDARLLLERLLGQERVSAELEAAQEIIRLVGNLPLALQIVGAALQLRAGRSLADYGASLSEERSRLGRLKLRGEEHLNVQASLSLSLEMLEPEEIDFFACVSVCAENGFSRQAAIAASGCEDEFLAEDYLACLYRLSLLNYSEVGENRFVFHPLIRLFAGELAQKRQLRELAAARHAQFYIEWVKSREENNPAVAAAIAEEFDEIILAANWMQCQETTSKTDEKEKYSFFYCLPPFLELYGQWQKAVELASNFQLLAQVNEDWDWAAKFRIKQAKYLSLQGEFSTAEEVLAGIPDILSRIEVESTRQRSEVKWLTTLGGIQQKQGQLDEALTVLQRSVEIAETLKDQPSLAIGLNSLGGLLQQLGRSDEALDAFQRQVAITETLNDQRQLAIGLNSLGGLLQQLGRSDEALDAFQRQVAITETLNDQRSLAIGLNRLGGLLQQLGRSDEALNAFQRSVAISETLNDQRSITIGLNRLGGLLQQLGRSDEALNAFQRSVAISETLNDQPSLAIGLNRLGGLLQQLGRSDEALDVFQRQVAISETLNDQRSITIGLNCLGGLLQQLGRNDEALDAFQRQVVISEALNDQRSITIGLNCLGGLLQQLGRSDEALDAFQRQVAITETLNDQPFAIGLNRLGGLLQQLGRSDEALDVFQRSVAISETLNDQPSLAIGLNRLGGLLQQLGRSNEALDVFQRSVALSETLNDQRSLTIGLNCLGGLLQQLGRSDEALDAFQRQVALSETLNDQPSLAIGLNRLGGLFQQLGRSDEALDVFQRSIAIEEQKGNARGLAMRLSSFSRFLREQNRIEEAIATLHRLAAIEDELGNPQGVVMTLTSIVGLLREEGRFEEAIVISNQILTQEKELGNEQQQAQTLTLLGGVLQQQGCLEEAIDVFERAIQLNEKLGQKQYQIAGLGDLAGLLHQQGCLLLQNSENWDKAEALLRRSQEIFEDLESDRPLAMVLNSLGGLLRKRCKWDEAEHIIRCSYDLAFKVEDLRGQAIVLNSLAQVLQLQESEEKFSQAIAAFKQSIKLGKEINDLEHLAKVHTAMGKALIHQRNFEEAAAQLVEGFKIDEGLKNKRGLELVTPNLTYALTMLGKGDEARTYCQKALEIAPKSQRLLELYDRIASPKPRVEKKMPKRR
ncbi:tetratricopeptide repeat protein [Laspinema sp. D1]|uniref:Tetratricopeptide repeat protein n=1 Tax=Laspinema palackyanum D2a TaxID=2953684 RepID=A0ABT2MXT2_9CYAN|nr:tetratricopeptide repeat protein [Laspinema sp. D2a]